MREGVFACLAVATACGRLEFDPRALTDAADTSDASPDVQPACAWGPWQTPAPVPELDTNQNNMGDPALRADGLEIVVAIDDGGSSDDLFIATRQDVNDPFGALGALTALNSAGSDNGAAFSGDGLTLYWMRNSIAGIGLFRATRGNLTLPFSNPEAVPGGPFDEQTDPTITSDGLELFHSSTTGDLYVSTRATTTDDFGMPVVLGAPLASPRWQEGMSISADGTTLFYVEVDVNSLFRVLSATRPNRTATFATPTLVTELLPDQSWDPELSADGSTLYFSRFVSGERDIWVTRRDCL